MPNTGDSPTIDTVMNFLSDTGINGTPRTFTRSDMTQYLLAGDINSILYGVDIIQDTGNTLTGDQGEQYQKSFVAYALNSNSRAQRRADPSTQGSWGELIDMTGADNQDYKALAADIGRIGKKYTELAELSKGTNEIEDLTKIGFYSINEEVEIKNGDPATYPRVIPSSIKIQEQLLNKSIPTIRSKSVGLSPDHRSKHIVHLDILYPTYEAFASDAAGYPSFINLLNMFKYLPINTILSPMLSSYFLSEYTFPGLYSLLRTASVNQEIEQPSLDAKQSKREYVENRLNALSYEEIQQLVINSDPDIDIGLSAIVESLSVKAFSNVPGVDLVDKIAKQLPIFPIPVSFKSASVQTLQDMPGAILARFAFSIVNSPAFPYGNVMYRDDDAEPSFDASDCNWGKYYVSLASKKQKEQSEKQLAGVDERAQYLTNPNYFSLYYSDFIEGLLKYDSSEYDLLEDWGARKEIGVILEKISGTFNSKSIEIPIMNSKFPNVQYMGMHNNGFQLMFITKSKKAISDLMALKARMLDYERKGTIQNSSAIIKNKFLNDLGVYQVSPQSISVESNPDNPELYHLTISFVENSQQHGVHERLELESGIIAFDRISKLKTYFYDLYKIWYEINFGSTKKDRLRYTFAAKDPDKQRKFLGRLNTLMEGLGIKKEYTEKDSGATVFNPGQGMYDVEYGPIFYAIMEAYSQATKDTSFNGYTLNLMPELENHRFSLTRKATKLQGGNSTDFKANIEKVLYYLAQGYIYSGSISGGFGGGGSKIDDVEPNRPLAGVLGITIPPRFSESNPDTGWRANLGLDTYGQHRAREEKNLIELFHNNGAPMPKEIWDGAFDAIVNRKHTRGRGSDSFVSRGQMDAAFVLLSSVILEYPSYYTFDIIETTPPVTPVPPPVSKPSVTKHSRLILTTWLGSNNSVAPGSKVEHTAELNLTELNQKDEAVNKFNDKKINLYEDMYCPTYRELYNYRYNYQLGLGKWMKAFGPKHGDFGTIPAFKTAREAVEAELNPHTYITNQLSVTPDHYIDPDIFYVRRRDKNLLHRVLEASREKGKYNKENLQFTIPINVNEKLYDLVMIERAQQSEEIGQSVPVTLAEMSAARVKFSQILDTALGSIDTSQSSRTDEATEVIHATEAWTELGMNEEEFNSIVGELWETLKQINPENFQDPNEYSTIPGHVNKTGVIFLGNASQFMGRVIWNPESGAYSMQADLDGLIGGNQNYYGTGADSVLELDVFDIGLAEENEETTMLHTPDLTNSMLKSFPAIRLYFIEEDNKSTYFVDDLYGFGDIMECSISTHTLDNDICRMKLANFGGVLSEMKFTDYSHFVNYSEWSERREKYTKKQVKVVDDENERFLRKILLRPGITIMLKMGYGNNLDTLKTVFTGEISEVKPGEITEIIAQGYQSELQHDYGGFYEEGWFDDFATYGEKIDKKFGFLQIINFMLIGDSKQGSKPRNGMRHLGEPLDLYAENVGIFGRRDSRYSYDDSSPNSARNQLREMFGSNSDYSSMQDILGDSQGDWVTWGDRWVEQWWTGFSGRNLNKNIYVATNNNTMINMTSEWLVVNQPVISALREVVRYMPNFICKVVPYQNKGTLFIGNPDGPFQYRPPTEIETKLRNRIDRYDFASRNQEDIGDFAPALTNFIDKVNKKFIKLRSRLQGNSSEIRESSVYKELSPYFAVYAAAPHNRLAFDLDKIKNAENRFLELIKSATRILGSDVLDRLILNYFRLSSQDNLTKAPRVVNSAGLLTLIAQDYYAGYRDFSGATLAFPPSQTTPQIWDLDLSIVSMVTNTNPMAPITTPKTYPSYANSFLAIPSMVYWAANNAITQRRRQKDIRQSIKTMIGNSDETTFIMDPNNLTSDSLSSKVNYFLLTEDDKFTTNKVDAWDFFIGDDDYHSNLKKLYSLGTDTVFNYHEKANLMLYLFLIENVARDLESNADNELTKLKDMIGELRVKGGEFRYLPLNYKIYRDKQVITTEHDLIANNLIATESDMWSAVAVKVPSDTIENLAGIGEAEWAQEGIAEGGKDRGNNSFTIDSDQAFMTYPHNHADGINFKGERSGPKDILENFTEINATTANLAQNVVKFRLAQGLSKMYRGNLIVLGRHIKPYDRIELLDNVNEMYGTLMVERVIQNFSVTDGWITTIVPCGLTQVNSQFVGVKRESPWAFTLAHGDSFKGGLAMVIGILIILTLGWGVLAALGYAAVVSVATATVSTVTLGMAARSVVLPAARHLGTMLTTQWAAGGGIAGVGLNLAAISGPAVGVFAVRQIVKGVADITAQIYQTDIHQSLFSATGPAGQRVIHLPCSVGLVYYKGSPFIAGLTDPFMTIARNDGMSNLFANFEDWLIEMNANPQNVTNEQRPYNYPLQRK
ncbi:MAG: hypothetical protein HOF66_06795 [Nitrosomonadaceae bacterium]|nr:hypothetical protein [Nitrosomonadaceae bacterium]